MSDCYSLKTDIPLKYDGCVFRFGDTEDIYFVESCRTLDSSSKVCFTLSSLSGVSIEQLVDITDIVSSSVERVTQETFFTKREICPLCSHPVEGSKVLFSVRQLFWNIEVRECCCCGMAYKDPIASQMLLAHLYSQNYTHFVFKESDGDTLAVHRSRVERLGKVRGRHLDYGCGAGRFVEAALLVGWDSYGADPFLPNIAVSSSLNSRLFKIDAANTSAILHAGKFDCISMWAVVEHLTSFKDTFAGLASMLNPGGTIVFNCPNPHSLIAKYSGNIWRMATLIEHLQFCSPTAVNWLASQYGFKVQRIRICGAPFPFGGGAGKSDQGLGPFPIPVPKIIDSDALNSQAVPFVMQKSATLKRTTLISRVVRVFLGETGGKSFGASIIRQLIHTAYLGDHIEVTLKLK